MNTGIMILQPLKLGLYKKFEDPLCRYLLELNRYEIPFQEKNIFLKNPNWLFEDAATQDPNFYRDISGLVKDKANERLMYAAMDAAAK